MKPILFSLGPLDISSFGLFLIFAFLLFTFIVWKKAKEKLYSEETVFDAVFFVSFFFFAGARASFIILNLNSFGADIFKWILFTGYPGFEFYGGLSGALLAFGYFFTRKTKKIPLWEIFDDFMTAFYPAYLLAQIGVLLGGREIGKTSNFMISVRYLNDPLLRHPVSMYRALILLIVFLVIMRNKNKPGLLGLCLLFIFALCNFLVDNLRESEVYYLNLTVEQWASLVFILICLYFIYRKIGYNFKDKVREFLKTRKKDV